MADNPFIEAPLVRSKGRASFIITILQILAVLLIVGLLLYTFVFTTNQVDGISMSPTFENNDVVFINRLPQLITNPDIFNALKLEYQHGEIIVMKLPNLPKEIIKRVVGLPGDKVAISGGKVILNGHTLLEHYLPDGKQTDPEDFLTDGKVITVPQDTFFVMGDNRDHSEDSRSSLIGLVKREYILGKVFLLAWPFEKFAGVNPGISELIN